MIKIMPIAYHLMNMQQIPFLQTNPLNEGLLCLFALHLKKVVSHYLFNIAEGFSLQQPT